MKLLIVSICVFINLLPCFTSPNRNKGLVKFYVAEIVYRIKCLFYRLGGKRVGGLPDGKRSLMAIRNIEGLVA